MALYRKPENHTLTKTLADGNSMVNQDYCCCRKGGGTGLFLLIT